jgi:hypothetical protein
MRIVSGNFPGPRKKNKKKLFFTLICAELLGILVLVWFLRAPLYEKFLAQPPKAYDSGKMLSTKQYLVSQNDQIAGKAEPNSKIKFYLSPLKQITVSRTDSQGTWIYQIPRNLPAGKYQLYVAFFGSSKEILIKNFHFRVVSRGILEKTIFGFNINSTVFAQDDGEIVPEIISEILSEEPVVDPLFQSSPPTTDCPETGCPEQELESVISQPSRCDPDTPGNIIQINSDTQEEESVTDESGLCSDPEILGDGTYAPIFYKIPDSTNAQLSIDLSSFNACITPEQLTNNRQSISSCGYLKPALDIFDTNIDTSRVDEFIALYSLIYTERSGRPQNEFAEKVYKIIEKSQSVGLNPIIFLGYWYAESRFGTYFYNGKKVSEFGCDPEGPEGTFEEDLNCALGLRINGEVPPENSRIGSVGPRCATSKNASSYPCRLIRDITNDKKNMRIYQNVNSQKIELPINTFDSLFEMHGTISQDLYVDSKGKRIKDNNNCIHSYNDTIQVILFFLECAYSPSIKDRFPNPN